MKAKIKHTLKQMHHDWFFMIMLAIAIHAVGFLMGQKVIMNSIKDVIAQSVEYGIKNIDTMDANCKGIWVFPAKCEVVFNGGDS